ncbi:hypothetical protein CDL15_Pgr011974 [Punica granatum]|uniref:At4g14310 8-bladed propeller domain-containing protein n=1 Tax=Punica granatum TaxID=22663 RepID=A0A218WDG1_PUNGR|nr:hypothetical protein CDL15_Pgr011974 [Punica granatum]
MSSSSVLRLKDRGGAGAKITAPKPSKPLTPISSTKPITSKENPNPKLGSRVSAQKPTIRPVPRISGDGASRFSTSSVPRGRSTSPFGRSNSVGKRDRAPTRVSLGGREVEKENRVQRSTVGVKSSEGSGYASRVLRKNGACEESEVKAGDFIGLGTKAAAKLTKPDVNVDIVGKSSERSDFDLSRETKDGVLMKKSEEKLITCEKPSNSLGISDKSKGKVSSLEGVKSEVGGKNQGRLHEKLAFLEGKVKRIASDIKRTKEMLDLNNPDESKVILSDIQEKISGIEKAMSHATGDSDAKNRASQEAANDIQEGGKLIEKVEGVVENSLKGSVKDLSSEELEARLFPHHKLLRNRTTLKGSKVEEKVAPKVEAKPLNLVNQNPISLEVRAFLSEKQGKVTDRDRQCGVETHDVQDMDIVSTSEAEEKAFDQKDGLEVVLTTDETLDELDDQENRNGLMIGEMDEDTCVYQLNEIGCKTATGGWFVSEGEAVLLVHSDGSCSYYDVANGEEKAVYEPSVTVSPNIWRDCWIVRAPGADGCSGRYVVAASAGNSLESGFCSWEFYSKDVRAFHMEDSRPTAQRTVLGPLPTNTSYRRNVLSNTAAVPETQQWWYRPCGPLIISTASFQMGVRVYDIRDGEQIMKWEMQKPVVAMDYSSPLQWRSRGKVVVADSEGVSLWDVNSLHPQALLAVVSSSGRKTSALHVNNTDAEVGGGVRQRVSSSEAEGNDGVFCTSDSIEVLDFRHPSGVGLRIKTRGLISADSVFSRGDSIFLGCVNSKPALKKSSSTQLQQFSLRKQALVGTYSLPDESTHSSHSAITQVWGNSNLTMGVSGLGLFVFDSVKDDALHLFSSSADNYGTNPKVREVIGPDDLYYPSFDYSSSRALIISRDRPALWRLRLVKTKGSEEAYEGHLQIGLARERQ